MTDAPEDELQDFDFQPREEPRSNEKKKSKKTSVLTKGLVKHSRQVKSNQGLAEHTRHVRTSSLGSNLMTHSNQYSLHRGYAKLSDQTFKSGDFNKLRTEMEELEFSAPNPFAGKGHHRRKTSLIKKIGTVHASNLSEVDSQPEGDNEKSKAFNLIADRIANSRATVETEQFAPSTPPGNDTNATFHKRTSSNEEEDKGVFKAFKEGEENIENKQLPLASNAVTNDTDNLASNTQGVKRILVEPKDFESIKEVDEQNDSFDARKQFEELDSAPSNSIPKVNLQKRVVSDGDYELGYEHKHKKIDTDFDEEYKNAETLEGDSEENEINLVFVEQKSAQSVILSNQSEPNIADLVENVWLLMTITVHG
eukprot:CAMPEP_0205827118 /NCGR_PEP_ID=MMETSP0206-20130828/30920_1 /ASSEMBLY_ACC=CAM_ASM_000279 /TAXON_ID=36767 /ORGANISM="Euplotes focardii, Strain TN1" /LENGTH=365 /DNA_ID=CAMNT_0053127707 /DNA_START=196 /DNA_END=1294 /DNA_ORIENTATION=+